jgi:hypothetical protein
MCSFLPKLGKVDPAKKLASTKESGLVQTKRWRERSSGSAFWTFKLDGTDKPEWSQATGRLGRPLVTGRARFKEGRRSAEDRRSATK